jgi:hypothetical protein
MCHVIEAVNDLFTFFAKVACGGKPRGNNPFMQVSQRILLIFHLIGVGIGIKFMRTVRKALASVYKSE